MPELPEVETVRTGLESFLPGKVVMQVTSDWAKSFPNSQSDVEAYLIGSTIKSLRRRGKVLMIDLNSGYSLVVHLKMTGQLVYRDSANAGFGAGHPNDSLISQLPDKSTRVIIVFSDGSKLFFNDQRKFGWVKLLPSVEIENLPFFVKLGPEPLSPDYNWQQLRDGLRRRSRSTIKSALLDQSVVAGIGNIYADESLWGARIHPATMAGAPSPAKIKKLHQEIQFVLRLSLEKGGSTDRNYVNAEGKKGSYLAFARVFRRQDQACPRCARPIVKVRLAGRGTHFCPHCQRLPKAD